MSPSINSYQGSPLYLHAYITGAGVSPNGLQGSGDSYVSYDWINFDICNASDVPEGSDCTAAPASSPVVTSPTGPVNCGTGNLACPAPAASFPTGTALPTPTNANPPTTTTIGGTSISGSGCATNVPGGTTQYGAGTAVFSPNGNYELDMTSSGVLELVSTVGAGAVLWTAPSSTQNAPATSFPNALTTAGSYFMMQTDGNLVLYEPGGASNLFNTSTQNNPGAYLAVQNDGNLVLYTAGNGLLWTTGTVQTSPCPPPG